MEKETITTVLAIAKAQKEMVADLREAVNKLRERVAILEEKLNHSDS